MSPSATKTSESSLSEMRKDPLIVKTLESRDKVLKFLEGSILTQKFQDEKPDVMFYFKAVMAFLQAGKTIESNLLMDYLQKDFIRANGDVISPGSKPGEKSLKVVYNKFYGYVNGWVAREGHKTGRLDVRDAVWGYYKKFQHPANGGQVTGGQYKGDKSDTTDFFSTSHLGITALEMNDLEVAQKAANYLVRTVQIQPDLKKCFWLQQTAEGELITSDFPAESKLFYRIATDEPDQLWFNIGFALVLLAKLYAITGNKVLKNTCDKILDFFDSCVENRLSCLWSHKVALGTSYMAAIMKGEEGFERYLRTCETVLGNLLQHQTESGLFSYANVDDNNKVDQTAELATWWTEIATNLARAKYSKYY